jgi:hypothetical protein
MAFPPFLFFPHVGVGALFHYKYQFFASNLAGIGKKYYLCRRNRCKILPIAMSMEYISVSQFAEKYGIY